MAPLERWNDDRLDDLARQVGESMRLRDKIAQMEIQLVQVHTQASQCLDAITAVRQGQDVAEEHRAERDEELRKERKNDRKWAIATVLTVLGLVIAALAIFVG